MKTLNLSISISDEAFELLKKILHDGYAEYRDTQFLTLAEFKDNDIFKDGIRNEEWFLSRNAGGSFSLLLELLEFNLVEANTDAWHTTYVISELGNLVLFQNQ